MIPGDPCLAESSPEINIMIKLKSPLEIAKMQVANQIVAEALAEITTFVKPNIETLELDALQKKSAAGERLNQRSKITGDIQSLFAYQLMMK
jgi:Xaa-Pro aminopeptidase